MFSGFMTFLGLAAGLLSTALGAVNATQQAKAYQEQHELNQEQLAFSQAEAERSQSNYESGLQIRVNDAKKAGLSPLAAVGNVGSSSVVSAPQRSVGAAPQMDTSGLNQIMNSLLSGAMNMKLAEQQHNYKIGEISKQGEIDKELALINSGASKYTADTNYNIAMAELDEAIRVHDYNATVEAWNEMMAENDLFGLYGTRCFDYESFVTLYDSWRNKYEAKIDELAKEYGVSQDSITLGAGVNIGAGVGLNGNFGKFENTSKVSYAIEALKAWCDYNPPPVPAFRTRSSDLPRYNHIPQSTVNTNRR